MTAARSRCASTPRRRRLATPLDPTLAPDWREGRGPLGFLPRLLFADRRPLLAILLAWVLTATVTLGIGLLIEASVSGNPGPELGNGPPVVIFLGLTLFSPIVETVLMAAILALLLRWLKPWQAVVASAAGWGAAHSLLAPWWGAVIWWPFLIFSILFVTWRRRGFWRAAAVPTVVHVLQNLLPAIVITLGR